MQTPASKCTIPEKVQKDVRGRWGIGGGGGAGEKGRVQTFLKKILELLNLSLLEILTKAKLYL